MTEATLSSNERSLLAELDAALEAAWQARTLAWNVVHPDLVRRVKACLAHETERSEPRPTGLLDPQIIRFARGTAKAAIRRGEEMTAINCEFLLSVLTAAEAYVFGSPAETKAVPSDDPTEVLRSLLMQAKPYIVRADKEGPQAHPKILLDQINLALDRGAEKTEPEPGNAV